MTERLTYPKVAPAAYRALLALENHVRGSGLDARLRLLVYQRVSQLNGCAFCLDMHDKELREAGESNTRLALLSVFREVPTVFDERERAALAFAEALTVLSPRGVSDEVYAAAKAQLSDAELVELSLAVATINAWNRVNVAFHTAPASTR